VAAVDNSSTVGSDSNNNNNNNIHFKSINHDGIGIFSSGSTILMKAKMYNIIRGDSGFVKK